MISEMTDYDYNEVKLTCSVCGREVTTIVFGEPDPVSYICQQCEMELEQDMDDD